VDEREILREIAEQKRREHVQLVAALGDVALAIHCDGGRRINHADIEHRFSTFVDARDHIREIGAGEAYRQALIELAAAATQVAALVEARSRLGAGGSRIVSGSASRRRSWS
jgi:hypothetical protein